MSISNILSMVDELTMRNINRVTSKVTKNSSRISLTVSVRGSNPARDKISPDIWTFQIERQK